jgi:carboxylate-amine ligase
MNSARCSLGLEQEFFLVDAQGMLSNKADLLLQLCQNIAKSQGRPPECFKPEFVKSVVEINTVPCRDVEELSQDYLDVLRIALCAARELNLQLYPLSTYPLHTLPVMRDQLNYHVQLRTIGLERFTNAAKCAGVHLHLGLPPGTINQRTGISYKSTPEARSMLLNVYNLATALDTALITLSRASPFYEGRVSGMAVRTMHYRGSEYYGWEGVYTHLQAVGGLSPYASSIEKLVEQQFYRYYSWLEAMDRAGVERRLFLDSGGELLKVGWNPVRINKLGTVELRSMDSNYPEVVLALVNLIVSVVNRVLADNLTVRPGSGATQFEVQGTKLIVPEFNYLNGELLYNAVTEGIDSHPIRNYLNSIFEFAYGKNQWQALSASAQFRTANGEYRTTEAEILQQFAPTTEQLSSDDGLNLVQHCCEQMEKQVLRYQHLSVS